MADAAQIVLDKPSVEYLRVPIRATAPILIHKFPEKAKREILDKQQGRTPVTQKRDPQAEYEASLYRIAKGDGEPDGYGFPAVGFKAATVSAGRFFAKSVKMTELRQFLFVRGVLTKAEPQQLVEIFGEPHLREDTIRLPGRKGGLTYRAEIPDWTAVLRISYITTSISRNSVLSLIEAGGFGVGVGDWRPEKNGDFGTYEIDQDKGVEVLES
jgi:hypothetical protein